MITSEPVKGYTMIDRNIRETRSKEETKKAKTRAVITAICVFIVLHFGLIIMNSVGKALLVDGEPVIPGVGLIQLLVGIVFFGLVLYVVYKIGKSRQQKTE